MNRGPRHLVLCFLASVAAPITAYAQAEQVLKDAWVATTQSIYEADPDTGLSGPKNPNDAARNLQAIAFALPDIGSLDGTRDLIAVDGTKIVRFFNGTNEQNPETLFDANNNPSGLRYVNTVSVTADGTALFSGYSRRKRRFELWEIDLDSSSPSPREVASGTPQLTDAVYISSEDVAVTTGPLAGGGLLAVADSTVLFFPADDYASFMTITDSRSLPIRNNTKILSADLTRATDWIVLATSSRELLTINYRTGAVAGISRVPNLGLPNAACVDQRAQRLLIRNVGSTQGAAANVLTDACGQVLAYSFDIADPTSSGFAKIVAPSDSFVALAVGEGNIVVCLAGEVCTITNGYTANIQTQYDSELLVLKVNNLCDPRVPATESDCYDAGADKTLVLNDLLPTALQDALEENGVEITIPPYMYAAAPDARFGAVFVQADEFSRDSLVTAKLEIDKLLAPFTGLGVAIGLPQGTALRTLLNNDVVAYAPDNPQFPTVRGFEATPVVVGKGSVGITKRGYSVDIYGLQHDLDGPGGRDGTNGGLPSGSYSGSPPMCDLAYGTQHYDAPDVQAAYFFNLVACLFNDMELLLTGTIIPNSAFVLPTDRGALIDRLNLTKDKLIKALNATGSSSGDQNFNSVLQQLGLYDTLLKGTPFVPQWVIYKNELIVRSEVFRFNIVQRAAPSIPIGGF